MSNVYKKLLNILGTFIILICVNGCTSTIYDKHKMLMEKSPNQLHYATAVPFHSGYDRNSSYRNACIHYDEYPSYHRKAEWPYQWYSASGGSSQKELESFTINECEKLYDRTCVVILYNQFERCSATFENAYTRDQLRVNKKKEMVKQAEEERIKNFESNRNSSIEKSCLSLGFKKNSQPFQQCALELYKSIIQIEAMQASSQRQSDSAEAYTREMKVSNDELRKLREFEASMFLLQQSSKILTPSQPTVRCKYSQLMQTVTCN